MKSRVAQTYNKKDRSKEKGIELYSLRKTKMHRKDKDKNLIEYENNSDECTF